MVNATSTRDSVSFWFGACVHHRSNGTKNIKIVTVNDIIGCSWIGCGRLNLFFFSLFLSIYYYNFTAQSMDSGHHSKRKCMQWPLTASCRQHCSLTSSSPIWNHMHRTKYEKIELNFSWKDLDCDFSFFLLIASCDKVIQLFCVICSARRRAIWRNKWIYVFIVKWWQRRRHPVAATWHFPLLNKVRTSYYSTKFHNGLIKRALKEKMDEFGTSERCQMHSMVGRALCGVGRWSIVMSQEMRSREREEERWRGGKSGKKKKCRPQN